MLELKISLFRDGHRMVTLKTSDGTIVESKVDTPSIMQTLRILRNCLHAVGYKDDSEELMTVDDAIKEFEDD